MPSLIPECNLGISGFSPVDVSPLFASCALGRIVQERLNVSHSRMRVFKVFPIFPFPIFRFRLPLARFRRLTGLQLVLINWCCLQLFFALTAALHLFTCAYWRVKLISCDPDNLAHWLLTYSVDGEVMPTMAQRVLL